MLKSAAAVILGLPRDGIFVATTYGHSLEDQEPFIVSVRFTLAELDRLRTRNK
jgi:hypothetical protein